MYQCVKAHVKITVKIAQLVDINIIDILKENAFSSCLFINLIK